LLVDALLVLNMLHRLLTLLLLFAYLIGQGLAVPHVHAGNPGHCAERHIHLRDWQLAGVQHRDDACPQHEHSHASPAHSHPHSHDESRPDSAPSSHDSDCVHLPDADHVLTAAKPKPVSPMELAGIAQIPMLPLGHAGSRVCLPRVAPHQTHAGCTLYLKLRTLLI
jgi:hypothetical protein